MLCLHLVSVAAVIRVVTRHATLLPTKGSGEERCVTSDDPNNGCEWDYVYTMPDSVSFMSTRKAIRYSMNTYPICDFPLYRSGRRASLRYRNHAKIIGPMCERKPFSAMVLLPAQKLSSVVWGFIGNNTLINIDAKNVEAKYSVPTKWEFYVGYFHSNFHHLNWFADTVRPFFGRDRAFSWRYSKSYTYDQLMAGTFACKTI